MIWNEADSDTFWQPRERAAQDYAALLARCWDVLHLSIAGVNVLTTTAASHDPAAFIRDVGAVYRASGRQRPLFDAVGHNPYSLFPGEAPTARHESYLGQGDYDRLVAVLDTSFAGTAQPPGSIWYLENGFQTTTAGKRRRSHYSGRESVARTLEPDAQAVQIGAALRLAHCQPRVVAYFNFLLVDETLLGGWQSGLLWADWRRKPAFDAYRAAIAEVQSGAVDCAGVLRG